MIYCIYNTHHRSNSYTVPASRCVLVWEEEETPEGRLLVAATGCLLEQIALACVHHSLLLGGLLHAVVDLLQLIVLVVHLQYSTYNSSIEH